MAHSCTFGTPATRLSLKFMAKYRLMLHVRYTRNVQED